MANDLARKVAECAARDLNVRENPNGSNDDGEGGRIRNMLARFGLRAVAWCAAAVCEWLDEAERELMQICTIRCSARAITLWEVNSTHQIKPLDATPDDFPCIFVEDHGDGKGHCGIAVGIDDFGNYQDISGNTTDKGTREGGNAQGVWANNCRNVKDQKLLGFLRID